MNQIEKIIDIATWNRKEHFEHFSAFDDPFFGVTVHVDCTRSYQEAKDKGVSFSLLLLHRIITAASKVEEFRYRIEGDKVVCYDSLLPEATVGRADHTFSFACLWSTIPMSSPLSVRRKPKWTAASHHRTEQRRNLPSNAIHYSAVPWLAFTDMKHPTNMRSGDSVPKISTGKYFREGEKLMLPISVTCHHGLMDGYHVAKFIETLDL